MIVKELKEKQRDDQVWQIFLNSQTKYLANQGHWWIGRTPNIPSKILRQPVESYRYYKDVLNVVLAETKDKKSNSLYLTPERDPIKNNKNYNMKNNRKESLVR